MNAHKVSVGGKKMVNLAGAPFNYLGAGGQAAIYQGNGLAYKVYHDPASMIPPGKIKELAQIQADNVIRPQDILYDAAGGHPVGYTMRYLADTQPLCKLFTKSFKADNNIGPEAIIELVKAIQLTMAGIHRDHCLVVDLNELNVLVGGGFTDPYLIDTDSYQTPSYRATAIMDSIRDRLARPGQFTELTDWFSFAVIATQLYLNIHPFKGNHPGYHPGELARRMDDNVSIFHPGVKLPQVCNPFSMVPKRHLDWLRAVFLHRERSVPPLPDDSTPVAVPAQIVLIQGDDKFEVAEWLRLNEDILFRVEFFGVDYFVTRRSVYCGTTPIWDQVRRHRRVLVCPDGEGQIIIAAGDGQGRVRMLTPDDQSVGQVSAKGMFYRNQAIYTVNQGNLYEHTFAPVGSRTLMETRVVDHVSQFTAQVYPGLVVQDLLGKAWLTIPYARGKCCSRPVPQLDGFRVVDARSEQHLCVVIAEKNGRYHRFILTFAADFAAYTAREEADVAVEAINFTVLPNGLCVLVDATGLQLFKGATVHHFKNPPIDSEMRLFNKNGGVGFLNGNQVCSLKMAA